jgi:hypothetical protein
MPMATYSGDDSDPLLVTLVGTVEQYDKDGKAIKEIAIVLNMSGLLIDGYLIPERIFLENSSGAIKAISDSVEETWAEAITKSNLSLHDISGGIPQFIHLKEAQFRVGNETIPAESREFWRGRLDRIDGFCLGGSL